VRVSEIPDSDKPEMPVSEQETVPSYGGMGPCLVSLNPALLHREYGLGTEEAIAGRSATKCQIAVSGPMISRFHFKIAPQGAGRYVIQDWPSRNGTFVNGERITRAVLKDGDLIGMGAAQPPYLRFQDESGRGRPWTQTLPAKPEWTIGRSVENDISMPFESTVSALHATLRPHGDRVDITDQNSLNGVWVNGYRTRKARLVPTDTVTIGSTLLRLQAIPDGAIHVVRRDCSDQISVESIGLTRAVLTRDRGRRVAKTLLDQVYLSIRPGEFIGILGPSGAGKTMLLKALNGYNPPDYGCVLLNETPLYHSYDMFRNMIGYVPQDDIVHADLTVQDSLNYVAKLRLPRDVSTQQRLDLVDSTMETLGLTHVRANRICELSGGQRKRVSIGCELITRPSILYLDEPTSGMDPSTEERLMRHFQYMARAGTTVLITTHILYNLDMLDRIVIMARGRLVFFGTPSEAMGFFTVKGRPVERATRIFEVLETSDTSTDPSDTHMDGRDTVAASLEQKYIESGLFKRHVSGCFSEVARDMLRISLDECAARSGTVKLMAPFAAGSPGTTTPRQTKHYAELLRRPVRRGGRFRLGAGLFSPRAFFTLTRRHFAIRFVSARRVLFYLAVPLILGLVTLSLRTTPIPDDAQVAQDKKKIAEQLVKTPGAFAKAGTEEASSTQELTDAADKIASSSGDVLSASSELSAKVGDLTSSTGRFSDSAKSLSSAAESLSKTSTPLPELAAAARKIVASTDGVTTFADVLGESAKKLSSSSQELSASADKLSNSAKELADSVKKYNDTPLDLGEAVKEILASDDKKEEDRPAVAVVHELKHEGVARLPVPLSVLLMFVMTSVFMGTLMSCLELSTERPIYLRERMANQKIADYLLSKLPFLLFVTAIQCAVFMGICYAKPGLRLMDAPTVYVALLAMTWTSCALGLLISALDPTPGQFSVILAIVAVLPQLVLSGGLGPDFYKKMELPMKVVASVFPARWGLEMLMTSFYNQPGRDALAWVKDVVQDPIGFRFGAQVFPRALGVLLAQGAIWLVLCGAILRRLDRKR